MLEINASKLFGILHTDAVNGLKSEDVEKNRAEFSSVVKSSKTLFSVFRGVFGDVFPIVFVILSFFGIRYSTNGYAFFPLLIYGVFYVIFKYLSIRYTVKVSERLNTAVGKVNVVRDGKEKSILDSDLAPGDILLLEVGDVVPCDAIVLWQDSLRVSELQLTGNAHSVHKMMQDDVLRGKGVPYYECIIFAGSVVMNGSARVLVCNIGRDVFDKKNKLTTRSKHGRKTRIFEVASFISCQMSLLWVIASFVLFIISALKGNDAFGMLHLCVTLAIASLPDLVLTLFDLNIYVTAMRLYKKGCIIQDMTSLDRMCDISCIILDDSRYFRSASPKPSTVYVNGERKKFRGAAESDVRELFEYALLASVGGENSLNYNGISVENSLIKCGEELGITQKSLFEKYPVLEKRPFTEANGISRVIAFNNGEFFIVSIGAPSQVLRTCSYIENFGKTEIFDEREKRTVRDLSRVIARANEGVVAVAVKKIEYKEGTDQIMNNSAYSFKGFIGLHTAINADSARAVSVCNKSGTDVVLMTPEGVSTSIGFAKSLSVLTDDDKYIEEKDFLQVDMGVFRADIAKYKVFVGLSPSQRADVASYRKDDGDIIAVTATSVDDLRLLLESDVSFCSAHSADDAASQNADVLVDGSFELIPECIKYARSVYRNTRHMLEYILNSQFVLFFATLLSLFFVDIVPLTSSAIMIYSLGAVLPLAFALSVRRLSGDELKSNFGSQNNQINVQNLLVIPAICGFAGGAVMALTAKSAHLFGASGYEVNGAAFITLISSSVFMAYAFSSDEGFDIGIFKNRYIYFSSSIAFAVMLLFTLASPLANFIGLAAPNLSNYVLSVIMGLIPSLLCIGIKTVKRYVFIKK